MIYATVGEYRRAVGASDTADDAAIEAVLEAASRLVDAAAHRTFGLDATASALDLDGSGTPRLWLPRDAGVISSVAVDTDADGTYELVLPAGADGYLTEPRHPTEAWPAEALLLGPRAPIAVWPEGLLTVRVTARWGWPEVPAAVRQATILVARQLRDLELSGPALILTEVGQHERIRSTLLPLVSSVALHYGVRLVA